MAYSAAGLALSQEKLRAGWRNRAA